MNTTLRYSLLRLLMFFAALMILWLVGLRNPLWLALAAATVSMFASLFLLSGLREQMSIDLVERRERRQRRRAAHPGPDEVAEDAGAAAAQRASSTSTTGRVGSKSDSESDPDAFR